MYEVKKASQLRRFFRHNDYTETAMDIIFNWLEKVNANFKDEDDFMKIIRDSLGLKTKPTVPKFPINKKKEL